MKWMKRLGYVVALLLFLIITLGPFLWTFFISITPKSEMFAANLDFLPKNFSFETYQYLFSGGRKARIYFTGLWNSMKAVGITLLIGLPISMMAGYALTKFEFPGRKWIKNSLLITMVIPVMATIIPLYKMFATGKMLDSIFWLSMVYVSAYLPMATWMIGNYLSTIPRELEEAAMMDGCGTLGTFFRVLLPLSRPILLSVLLIMFLNTWSQFQIPLILASSMETKPMAIVVSEFVTKDTVDYGLIAAAGMISLLPPAITALLFRRYLVSGMMKGSVKG